jgi:hypothetical protein
MYLTVAVAIVDAGLAGALLAMYGRAYTRIRAPFTFGLILFAGFFLAQNLLAAYGYLVLMVFLPDDVQPIMLAIMLLEALALGMMVYSAVLPNGRRTGSERKAVRLGSTPAAGGAKIPSVGGKGP